MALTQNTQELISRLVAVYREFPQVTAIALGGSLTGNQTDTASDIDLYVYTSSDIPLEDRRKVPIQLGGASRADLGMTFWGPGDEWFDAASGIEIDIVYFDDAWMKSQLERVIRDAQPSLGYSTCFWYTVLHSQLLFDREGWFNRLQEFAQQPYPELLRSRIIEFNYPVLREVIPSYLHQIEKALKRGDLVSVNHRLAAFFASYFDILFALHRNLHPGEKRLLQKLRTSCVLLPVGLETDVNTAFKLAGEGNPKLISLLNHLVDGIDLILSTEGVSTPTGKKTTAP